MGYQEGKAWQRALENSVSWDPEQKEWNPERGVHVAAVYQTSQKEGQLKSRFIEDKKELHDAAIANIFPPGKLEEEDALSADPAEEKKDTYTVVLQNGEHLPYVPDQTVQIFEKLPDLVSADELHTGDYVEYGGHRRRVERVLPTGPDAEMLAQVELAKLGTVTFFKGDPATSNLVTYRAISI